MEAPIVTDKRTLPQNDRLHACLTDIVRSGYQLHGRAFSVEDWKTLFVSLWMGETGRSQLVRGINNELVQLYWRTSRMKKKHLGEVLILVEKFCAERGIQLRDTQEAA